MMLELSVFSSAQVHAKVNNTFTQNKKQNAFTKTKES